ncbi:hypothetical protein SUGI_0643350 [Cryptomeria japonica]|uniref:uncharacterized protein LOC131069455 n=1 Tax=Cryptomeria japonica TaxID=3369 RepID=UPI002414B287|nr:uncharacterized protein LOC131069455 [Cryptomeria japonica]GLJ31959.1 hypothetical protein SUGI_0643350 [Cryptomeria japonica]
MKRGRKFYSRSLPTSIIRTGLLCLFTVLFLLALLKVPEFRQIVRRPSSLKKVLEYNSNANGLNSSLPPFLLRTDENTYVGSQGSQIFINCSCPQVVQNCTKDIKENFSAAIEVDKGNVSKTGYDFSILIGVLTRADLYERRHFLRMVYGIQSTVHAKVDVRFVFCNLTKDDQRILVPLEIMAYNDIIILNCEENMNEGKTYAYFSSLPKMGLRYDYVMKVDDDIYFRMDKLAESLKPLPRNDTYYGFVIPCDKMDPYDKYMSGMGYALSWDLVKWIEESPIAKNNTMGPEDLMVGKWLHEGKKAKNRFNNKPAMYDFPLSNGKCSHEFVPDTIAVHKLKNRERWFSVLTYFNFTSALKESKLYHLY